MVSWHEFESSCSIYLKKTFGRYATFECMGGSDSTISDIKVCTNHGKQFYIEAKKSPAQCGQFVLLPDISTKKFRYSTSNTTKINIFSETIIAHMNKFFTEYKEAGTKGKDIKFENGNNIFTSWIIQHYREKNVKFIITNNNILLPIEDLANYFDITATYRIKRSGSANVSRTNGDVVQNYLAANYNITKSFFEDKKLFVTSQDELDNERFIIDDTEYMISKRKSQYEIRKLSNTFNANVIFSITFVPGQQGLNNAEFISILKQIY